MCASSASIRGKDDGQSGLAPGDDMALALARHEIKAEAAKSWSGEISVGDEILSQLADHGCDLLVMGCYGHSLAAPGSPVRRRDAPYPAAHDRSGANVALAAVGGPLHSLPWDQEGWLLAAATVGAWPRTERTKSSMLNDRLKIALLTVALLGLPRGLGLTFADLPSLAETLWIAGVLPVLAALVVEIVRSLCRGEVGLDIVAALSMSAALLFGETLAAAVVALMYSGGTFLESFAEGRARREMSDLLSRVPRTATRHRDGGLEEVPLDEIAAGRPAADPAGRRGAGGRHGRRATARLLDQSALTGESMPVRLDRGDDVMSGSTNAGEAFDLAATQPRAATAPMPASSGWSRRRRRPRRRCRGWPTATRCCFLAVTVALADAAWWFTGDPIRAVAVLVVATPCPLILAVPVALVAGLSRAAHFGVLIKGAKPLEALARIRTLILDKTGTLTDGRPQIVVDRQSPRHVARRGAALRRGARPGVQAPDRAGHRRRGAGARPRICRSPRPWPRPRAKGVAGDDRRPQGRRRRRDFVARAPSGRTRTGVRDPVRARARSWSPSRSTASSAGHLVMADALRIGHRRPARRAAPARGSGASCWRPATGAPWPKRVTEGLGLDAVRADLTPDQKVLLVLTERKNGPVMMVGDGVNDAPALAAADVGVAMGARGRGGLGRGGRCRAAGRQLDRLVPGIEIARRVAPDRARKRRRRDRPVGRSG